MANKSLPVIGTQGYVEDPSLKFVGLLMNYMVTDPKQTLVLDGELFSLSSRMQESGTRIDLFIQGLDRDMRAYLSRYFENVAISVSQMASTVGDLTGKVDILLDVKLTTTATSRAKDYRFQLTTVGKQFKELQRINNYGE